MESVAHYIIGVRLEKSMADTLTFFFQQDILGKHTHAVRVQRHLLEQWGPAQFVDRLTSYYLNQHPAETERVGWETVRLAVVWALQERTGNGPDAPASI